MADSLDSNRGFLDYRPVHIPLSVLDENYTPPVQEEESTMSLWDAATRRQWTYTANKRNGESQEIGDDVHGYAPTVDDISYLSETRQYSDKEKEYLFGSTSQENFSFRQEKVQMDRDAKRILDAAGVKGLAYEVGAAVIDPGMLPLLFIDAPAVLGVKASKALTVGSRMLQGASEATIQEYIMQQADTQRSADDIYLAAMAGFAFSGAAHLVGAAFKHGPDAARASLGRMNEVEATQRAGIDGVFAGKGYNAADEALAREVPDPVARKRVLSEKEILGTLRREVGEPEAVMSRSSVQKLKDEFRAYKASREDVIANIGKRPGLRPAARRAEIAQVTAAIAKRQGELDAKIQANQLSAGKRSSIDALQQGAIPKHLEARYQELKMESGQFEVPVPKTRAEIAPMAKAAPPVDTGAADLGGPASPQSMGAMLSRREFEDINTADDLLGPTEIDEVANALSDAAQFAQRVPTVTAFEKSAAFSPFRSLSTDLNMAPDAATRGIAAKVFKNPQHTIPGHQSSEELAETLAQRVVPDYLDESNAFELHTKELGINPMNIGKLNEARIAFDREVVLLQASGNLLSNKPVAGDSPQMLAAKARSRIYEAGLDYNKNYSVVGFDKIKHRHEYHSVVFDATNIQSVNAHADFIVDAVAAAYQTGGIKLSRDSAVRLAQSQLRRTFERYGSNKSFDKMMSDSDFNLLSKELHEKGVDAETIADLKRSLFNKEEMENLSPRAMFSLQPNLKARSGDVWFVDLIDTSMERVMKYAHDGAANAGLASQGFHSRHQFQRAITAAHSQALNELRSKSMHLTGKAKEEADRALAELLEGGRLKQLDEGVRLMYREPLEDSSKLADASRVARKAVSVVRLRTTGLMTVPEFANAMLRNGVMNTLRQLPVTRFFDLRKKSIVNDDFMSQFNRTITTTGHQEYIFGRQFYNNSAFDDKARGMLGKIDKLAGKALDITMTVNGFRTFQNGGEEMVARSCVSNIADMAKTGKITPAIRRSLMSIGGLSETQLNDMIKHMQTHPNDDVFAMVRTMPFEMHNRLATAVRNTISGEFMRLGIGERPLYMNKEIGKIPTSLMSFSIGSFEKMLLRGIKHEKALMLSLFAGQAALGYLSLAANTYIQANHLDGRERDEFIQKRLNDEGLFWGVMNRVGILAGPMMYLQALKSVGGVPLLEAVGVDKKNVDGLQSLGGIQSAEMIKDAARATSSGMTLATQRLNRGEKEKAIKDIERVVPWYNSTLWNLTFGVAE